MIERSLHRHDGKSPRQLKRHPGSTPENRQAQEIAARIVSSNKDLANASARWHELTSQTPTPTMVEMAYSGNPFALDTLNASRALSINLRAGWTLNTRLFCIDPDFLNSFRGNDFYAKPYDGVSLWDIENMQNPLSIEDIRKISRMFFNPLKFFKKIPRDQKSVLESIVNLATGHHIPDESGKRVPESLKMLRGNLESFFDFYTYSFIDTTLSGDEQVNLVYLLGQGAKLPEAVAIYLPARLGISPSSASKLLQWRYEQAELAAKLPWKVFCNRSLPVFPYAKRVPSQLGDLSHFLDYAPNTDQQASDALKRAYPMEKLTKDE